MRSILIIKLSSLKLRQPKTLSVLCLPNARRLGYLLHPKQTAFQAQNNQPDHLTSQIKRKEVILFVFTLYLLLLYQKFWKVFYPFNYLLLEERKRETRTPPHSFTTFSCSFPNNAVTILLRLKINERKTALWWLWSLQCAQNAYSLSYFRWGGGAFPVGLLNQNHINIEHLSN